MPPRVGRAPPSTTSGPVRDPAAPPEPFRDDLRVPVLCFEAETDLMVLDYFPARQPDNDKFRLWEVAGTAHADVYTFVAGFIDSGALPIAELAAAWKPTTAPLGFELERPVNTGPQHYVLQAALAHFDRWLRDGTPPPRAPRLEVRDDDPTQFVVDEHGNARGGIRTPHVDVPVAVLSGIGNDGGVIARICGATEPFTAEKLASLYSSKADYCAKFDAATDAAVAAGWFLEADAAEIKAIAAELYPASTTRTCVKQTRSIRPRSSTLLVPWSSGRRTWLCRGRRRGSSDAGGGVLGLEHLGEAGGFEIERIGEREVEARRR